MKKSTYLIVFVSCLILSFQNCKSTKDASVYKAKTTIPNVTYKTHIQPIMVAKCTPCHYPKFGRKKMLNTYAAAKENITDILTRVQLQSEDIKFMPFKGKRPALTNQELELFKNWFQQNMPE